LGLFHWLQNAFVIVLAGMVVEPRVSKRLLIGNMVGSVFFGGLFFTLTSTVTLVGSVMISWGMTGLLFACWLKFRHGMRWPEHAIAGYLLISTLFRLTELANPFTPSIVACYLTLLLSFGFFIWRLRAQKGPAKNKEITSKNQRTHSITASGGSE
jgi:hypothetical protein